MTILPVYLFNLNLNGIAAQTITGPLFIIAGVKTHCFAAASAGSLKISASLFIIITFRTFPSLSTKSLTQTVPSMLARLAKSGYSGDTCFTGTGCFSTGIKAPGSGSSSIFISTPVFPPVPSGKVGLGTLDISCCVAIVCSGFTSASGTGTGTPIVGFVTGTETATCGAASVFVIEGGGPSSLYHISRTVAIFSYSGAK